MSDSLRYRRFVDQETGEVLTGSEIYEAVSDEVNTQSRFEWLKLYPRLLPLLQDFLKSRSFDVIVYMIQNMKYATNEFTGSRSEIEHATNCKPATIARVFSGLQTYDLIRPVRMSTWMINPRILHGGGKHMDNALLLKYSRLPVSEKSLQREQRREDDELSDLLRRVHEIYMKEGDEHDDNE